jgi:hypothetical protein
VHKLSAAGLRWGGAGLVLFEKQHRFFEKSMPYFSKITPRLWNISSETKYTFLTGEID